jgi:peptide/nickel transport system permease protein
MGVADTMLALPTLVLILAARAAFPLELPPIRAAMLLVLIFAAVGWAETARLTRGLVRSIKQREYILAARAIGLSEARIMLRHILPNAWPTILRQGLVTLPTFLLAEVALSFLGVGLQEPEPSLGTLLAAAADVNQLQRDPLIVLAPGIVITVFVLAIRIVGGPTERKFSS